MCQAKPAMVQNQTARAGVVSTEQNKMVFLDLSSKQTVCGVKTVYNWHGTNVTAEMPWAL